MKINGLKHLNSNWYNYIMIRNLNSDEIKVNVKNDDNIKTIKNNNTFYDSIKDLTDKEKTNEIIRYYLRNNKIHCINGNAQLDNYDGYFIVIEGSRNLYLQLKEDTIDKKIIKEIKEKYIKDRYEYLFGNYFKKIDFSFRENESSYYLDNYRNDNEEVLNIHLNAKNKDLLNYEKKFFNNYIEYLFDNTDKKINYHINGISVYMYKHYETLKFGEFPGNYFGNNDFLISVNDTLFSEVYYLMNHHNKEIEDVKKLQLTIDDIYKMI